MKRDIGTKKSYVYVRHLIINYIHSPDNTLVQKSKRVYLVCLFVLVYFLLTYPKKIYIYIYHILYIIAEAERK